jgi:hypothetical protein
MFNTTTAQTEPSMIVDDFFIEYSNGNIDKALNDIFSTNSWLNQSNEQVVNLEKQLNKIIGLLGEYHGHELVSKKSIGNSLVLYQFLVKYDRQPLRFSFLLYNSDTKWRLQNFEFDDGIEELLEE